MNLLELLIIIAIIYGIVKAVDQMRSRNTTQSNNRKVIHLNDNIREINEYKNSVYYKETGIEYENMITDTGKAGEYATYKAIKDIPGYKRFVFNTYVEKGNGKTTEIDIIMIHEKGIFVIECKNYNSFISGDESQKNWCASYAGGKEKHFFLNPIIQNSNHIRYLREKLNGYTNIHSIIVFGNGATIKNIKKTSSSVTIIKNREIRDVIISDINSRSNTMPPERVDEIYSALTKISGKNVSNEVKEQHIKNITGEDAKEKSEELKSIEINNEQTKEIILSIKEKELIIEFRKLNEEDKEEEFERIKKIANF